MTPFVLDFDLDFFTLETNEGTMAWPQQIWQKHFDGLSDGAQWCVILSIRLWLSLFVESLTIVGA